MRTIKILILTSLYFSLMTGLVLNTLFVKQNLLTIFKENTDSAIEDFMVSEQI